MSKPVVLITSATSKNGVAAAKLLIETGDYAVRLGCRDPTKLQALINQGAEGVELNGTPESAAAALKDVSYLYIILPTLRAGPQTQILETYLRIARENQVKHVIYLSDLNVNCEDHFAPVHDHYAQQQLVAHSTLPFTILQPAWFHENTVTYHADSVKYQGAFFTCAGDGVWTSVAVDDIAAAVVAIVRNPNAHAGKVYRLQTESLTDDMLAEKVSKATGKPVRHVNVTPEEYVGFLRSHFGDALEESFVTGILRLDEAKRESRFAEVSPDLERILKRKGVSVDAFLADRAAAFSTAA
jgi:NAD(P)H dehydrogenase (quinone)